MTRRVSFSLAALAFVVAGTSLFAFLAASSDPRAPLAMLRQESFRRVPVVMVVFDELPVASLMNARGQIDRDLFPSFARLQRDSVWFRNTSTTSEFSNTAVPTILTGKYIEREEPFEEQYHPRNIFTLLGDAYDIRGVRRLPGMCPFPACDSSDDTSARARRVRGFSRFAADRGKNLVSFLEMIEGGDEPRFYFVHSVMPHYPWRYLPTGQRYPDRKPVPGEIELPGRGRGWGPDRWLVTQAYQRHLLQLQLVDRTLGALMRRLRSAALYDEALLVVTADHGISFEPSLPKRWLMPETVGGVAAVPLFVKKPFQRQPLVSDLPVETVDILPTVADVLDLANVWPDLDGSSALDGSVEPGDPREIEGVDATIVLDPRGREKYGTVARKYSMLGLRRSDGLFGIGPGRSESLLGRSVRELDVGPFSSAEARVRDPEIYETTPPDAPMFPALLEGTLRGVDPAPRAVVAAAVNNTIAAVTRTFEEDGRTSFYLMLSPEAFAPPPNELRLYLVEDAGSGRLIPLG